MRRGLIGAAFLMILGIFAITLPTSAASSFADPAFQQQWQTGEAITPNFWGPLSLAKDGQQEPYKEVAGGQRLVQYFDKGRMELTNGKVTNGLLAKEIVKGQIQTGDAVFQSQSPPAISVAGDLSNPGPTYAQLNSKAKALFDAAPSQTGNATQAAVSSNGDVSVSTTARSDAATFVIYDDATKHNVAKAFADYRSKAGIPTIGLALCEPFSTNVKVGGQSKQVVIQVFERRVLTYTASNDPTFQVEMGNIGQHYYQWRYGGATPTIPATTQAIPTFVSATVIPPTAVPTKAAATPTSPPATMPQMDDNAYAQYLQNKFGNIGNHKILLDKVSIDHVIANDVVVDFETKSDEVDWMYNKAAKSDLQTWGSALLQELKAHWPEETHWSE